MCDIMGVGLRPTSRNQPEPLSFDLKLMKKHAPYNELIIDIGLNKDGFLCTNILCDICLA